MEVSSRTFRLTREERRLKVKRTSQGAVFGSSYATETTGAAVGRGTAAEGTGGGGRNGGLGASIGGEGACFVGFTLETASAEAAKSQQVT